MPILNIAFEVIAVSFSLFCVWVSIEFYGRALGQNGWTLFDEIAFATVCLETAISTLIVAFLPESQPAHVVRIFGFVTIAIVASVGIVRNRDSIFRQ